MSSEFGGVVLLHTIPGIVVTVPYLYLKNGLGESHDDCIFVMPICKIFGIVQSTNDFKQQHLVVNGCSDLMMEVFGNEIGFHARSAIGTNTLPLNVAVEIEAIVQIRP